MYNVLFDVDHLVVKMKTIIVFEDSSRVDFGGGQQMMLMVCKILQKRYNLRFVDYSNTTHYAQIVKMQYSDNLFINIGHVSMAGQWGLGLWIKIVLSTLFCCFTDAAKILHNLDPNDCISYSTNKRSLLMAAFLKWHYHIPYVQHAHLVENPKDIYFLLAKRLFAGAESVLCVSKTVKESIDTPNCQLIYNPISQHPRI